MKLGWDQRTISQIESGSKRASVVELIALGKVLAFDPAAAVRRVAKGGEAVINAIAQALTGARERLASRRRTHRPSLMG